MAKDNSYAPDCIDRIIEIVCKNTGVDQSDLIGKCRKRELADSRKIVIYLADKYLSVRMYKVAEKIGMKGFNNPKNACICLMQCDKSFRNRVEIIEAEFMLN